MASFNSYVSLPEGMKLFINEKNLRFKWIDPHKGATKMIFLTLALWVPCSIQGGMTNID